jgi:hypothetical protein
MLATKVGVPKAMNLKCNLYTGPIGKRPTDELEPMSHPLALAQQNGISRQRQQEMIERLMHSASGSSQSSSR